MQSRELAPVPDAPFCKQEDSIGKQWVSGEAKAFHFPLVLPRAFNRAKRQKWGAASADVARPLWGPVVLPALAHSSASGCQTPGLASFPAV